MPELGEGRMPTSRADFRHAGGILKTVIYFVSIRQSVKRDRVAIYRDSVAGALELADR